MEIERLVLEHGLEPSFQAEEQLSDGDVGLWWLGQAGFALRYGAHLLLIDPYLSDSLAEKYRNGIFKHDRLVPIPVRPESIAGCEAMLSTHGHTDHLDPPTIRGVQVLSIPLFIVPRAETARALERGVPPDRLQAINAGERVVLSETLTVEAIPSAHEELSVDTAGNHRFLGYIVTLGSVRIYHSGDCVPYHGLLESLSSRAIDLALLPINGRDAARLANGVPGNFTAREAVELCAAAGIEHLFGHHTGMFAFNSVDPVEAAQALRSHAGPVQWLLPEIGPLYRLRPNNSSGAKAPAQNSQSDFPSGNRTA